MAVDAPAEMISILESGWNSSNTDNKTPRFVKIGGDEEGMRQSVLLATEHQDLVTVYETTAPHPYSGVGGTFYRHSSNLVIDMRVANQYEHALKVREEIMRLLFANKAAPAGSFDKILGPHDIQNLSDKSKKLHRYTIKAVLITHRRTYA